MFTPKTLEGKVAQVLRGSSGDGSAIITSFADGVIASFRPNACYESASLAKLAIATYVTCHGLTMPSCMRLTLKPAHCKDGTGILRAFPAGFQLSLEQALALMLVASDNTAANIILDRLDGQRVVNQWFAIREISSTGLTDRADNLFESGEITPANVLMILRLIDSGQEAEIKRLLRRGHFQAGLRGRPITGRLIDLGYGAIRIAASMLSRRVDAQCSSDCRVNRMLQWLAAAPLRFSPQSGLATKEGTLRWGGHSYLHEAGWLESGGHIIIMTCDASPRQLRRIEKILAQHWLRRK